MQKNSSLFERVRKTFFDMLEKTTIFCMVIYMRFFKIKKNLTSFYGQIEVSNVFLMGI